MGLEKDCTILIKFNMEEPPAIVKHKNPGIEGPVDFVV